MSAESSYSQDDIFHQFLRMEFVRLAANLGCSRSSYESNDAFDCAENSEPCQTVIVRLKRQRLNCACSKAIDRAGIAIVIESAYLTNRRQKNWLDTK